MSYHEVFLQEHQEKITGELKNKIDEVKKCSIILPKRYFALTILLVLFSLALTPFIFDNLSVENVKNQQILSDNSGENGMSVEQKLERMLFMRWFTYIICAIPYVMMIVFIWMFKKQVIDKHSKILLNRLDSINDYPPKEPTGNDMYDFDNSFPFRVYDGFKRAGADILGNKLTAVFNYFTEKEQERVMFLVDDSRRHMLSIVRMGIIGTFVGLASAFIIFASDLSLEQEAKKEFIQASLVQSLFGYASAVFSSLLANTLSLLYEKSIVERLVKVNFLGYVGSIYKRHLFGTDDVSETKQAGDQMSDALEGLSKKLKTRLDDIKLKHNQIKAVNEGFRNEVLKIAKTFSEPEGE